MKLHETQQGKLAPLRRDVHFLGELLGRVLIHQESQTFFEAEERIRQLAIATRRTNSKRDDARLHRLLERLPLATAEKMIRAFSKLPMRRATRAFSTPIYPMPLRATAVRTSSSLSTNTYSKIKTKSSRLRLTLSPNASLGTHS